MEHTVLLAQEVDDLELTGVDPCRHPEDQEPHSFGAHRGTMVALPVRDEHSNAWTRIAFSAGVLSHTTPWTQATFVEKNHNAIDYGMAGALIADCLISEFARRR